MATWYRWVVYREDGHQVVIGGDTPARAEHAARGVARALGREGQAVRIGPLSPRRAWMRWDELADPRPSA